MADCMANLWITGLAEDTRTADLISLFSKWGKVQAVKIAKNSQRPEKRYGLVKMGSSGEAACCIQHLHGFELHGQKIYIKKTKHELSNARRKTKKEDSEKNKEDLFDRLRSSTFNAKGNIAEKETVKKEIHKTEEAGPKYTEFRKSMFLSELDETVGKKIVLNKYIKNSCVGSASITELPEKNASVLQLVSNTKSVNTQKSGDISSIDTHIKGKKCNSEFNNKIASSRMLEFKITSSEKNYDNDEVSKSENLQSPWLKSSTEAMDETSKENSKSGDKDSQKSDKESNLWVSGLTEKTRVTDLIPLFSKYGKVLTVKILKSSNSKSISKPFYGFVKMAASSEALSCVNHLNHVEFQGQQLAVKRTNREPVCHKNLRSNDQISCEREKNVKKVQALAKKIARKMKAKIRKMTEEVEKEKETAILQLEAKILEKTEEMETENDQEKDLTKEKTLEKEEINAKEVNQDDYIHLVEDKKEEQEKWEPKEKELTELEIEEINAKETDQDDDYIHLVEDKKEEHAKWEPEDNDTIQMNESKVEEVIEEIDLIKDQDEDTILCEEAKDREKTEEKEKVELAILVEDKTNSKVPAPAKEDSGKVVEKPRGKKIVTVRRSRRSTSSRDRESNRSYDKRPKSRGRVPYDHRPSGRSYRSHHASSSHRSSDILEREEREIEKENERLRRERNQLEKEKAKIRQLEREKLRRRNLEEERRGSKHLSEDSWSKKPVWKEREPPLAHHDGPVDAHNSFPDFGRDPNMSYNPGHRKGFAEWGLRFNPPFSGNAWERMPPWTCFNANNWVPQNQWPPPQPFNFQWRPHRFY